MEKLPDHHQDPFDLILSSIVLDQIRSVDKSRLLRKLGSISVKDSQTVSNVLVTMFSE